MRGALLDVVGAPLSRQRVMFKRQCLKLAMEVFLQSQSFDFWSGNSALIHHQGPVTSKATKPVAELPMMAALTTLNCRPG
jgi:hypothetical protein